MVYLTKVTDALTLCLNGHSIRAANHGKAIVVANGGALTLTDCIGAGKLIHTSGYAGTGVCILTDGTFTMYSGIITGNNSLDNSGGVTIGAGSIIAAGAVVTRNIPPNSIAAGVPVRVLRQVGESDRLHVWEKYVKNELPR